MSRVGHSLGRAVTGWDSSNIAVPARLGRRSRGAILHAQGRGGSNLGRHIERGQMAAATYGIETTLHKQRYRVSPEVTRKVFAALRNGIHADWGNLVDPSTIGKAIGTLRLIGSIAAKMGRRIYRPGPIFVPMSGWIAVKKLADALQHMEAT